MDRLNQIINHYEYRSALQKNEASEEKRVFCKHGLEHFLDVARIAYIIVLEEKLPFTKDVIYAAALLHDIGRFQEYEGKLSHERASANIALGILETSGYEKEEIAMILDAIENHRQRSENQVTLDNLIYKADKMSRNCYSCKAKDLCNWSENKKNKGIII